MVDPTGTAVAELAGNVDTTVGVAIADAKRCGELKTSFVAVPTKAVIPSPELTVNEKVEVLFGIC
jgi:hypothetical protein